MDGDLKLSQTYFWDHHYVWSQVADPLLAQSQLPCVCPQWLSHVQLCDPMNCSPPGSSVHGTFQARVLEWVVISSSRGSSWPRDWTCVSCSTRQILYHCTTCEAPIGLVYSQMGHSSTPSQFKGILWLGSNVQILPKAEIGDHAPDQRKKALAPSLSNHC